MFACFLLLGLVCLGHLVVHAFPADVQADLLALLQPIDATSALSLSNATDTASLNGSAADNTGHHWAIPNSHMTLHVTLLTQGLPLPTHETLTCLRSFIDQLNLFPKDRSLDRLRYVVYNDLQAILAPSHRKPPLTDITFAASKKSIAALWYFISRSDLLFELRFAVFENGIMVAWGLLGYRDGWPPSPKPAPVPVPTAVE